MISNSFKIQTIVYGWSYFLPMKLYLKFWVIPTSFDPVLPSGYKSAPLRDKVFDFLEKNQNHCPSFCAASHQVFYWKIMPKNVQNTKKNMSNRKIRKRSKNATNRALEIWVAGFWWKSIFGSFSHFQAIWPLWFSENHLFGARNPSIFNNITDSLSECLEIVIRPTKKAYLLPHRSRNQQDGWCRPTGNNQCLKLHDHLTTIDARSSSAIKAFYVQKNINYLQALHHTNNTFSVTIPF